MESGKATNLFAFLPDVFPFALLHIHQELIETEKHQKLNKVKISSITKPSYTYPQHQTMIMVMKIKLLFIVTILPVVLHSNPLREAFLLQLVPLSSRGKGNVQR